MAWSHPVATVVIDATDQQRFGFGACDRVSVALVVELGLHRVKEITIEDGGLPAGDCNRAMMRACFEARLAPLPLGSIVVCCEGFAAPPAAVDEGADCFFTDFDIEILRSVRAASRRTTEAPPRPSGRRGRHSER